tara:strand:- start:17169 stop:17939 length:771 start_codon:yes stop_codon:yes gene_type:complete
MNGRELKNVLQGGGKVYGTMISVSRNPKWIPLLNDVGLDYVIIDTEHNPRGRGELGDFLTMWNTIDVVPIVRIPIPDSHYVTMTIDAGAQGVLAPYCETVDQVEEVIGAAKWRPLKGQAVRDLVSNGTEVSEATTQYLENRNQNNIAIIGIESVAAVNNLEEILKVPGIDGIFVGPNDLSISLGIPDDYNNPKYIDTVKHIIATSESAGIPVLVHQQSMELSEFWADNGARFILHGTDRRAMVEGFKSEFTKLRNR